MKSWYVYILRCADGTLYTGITNDLEKRIKAHNEGHGARYTRSRRPVEMVYSEPAESRSAATLREAEVKRMSRKKKLAMIAGNRGDEEQRLKDIACAWMALWQGGSLDEFDRLHAPQFVDRSPSGRGSDRAAFRQGIEDFCRAFPDFKAHTEDFVVHVQSGQVVIRWTATGTHCGAFLGEPATNRPVTFSGIEIIRILDGQVTERWGEWDGLGLAEQLRAGGGRTDSLPRHVLTVAVPEELEDEARQESLGRPLLPW